MINIKRSNKPNFSFKYDDFEIVKLLKNDFFELCYICEEYVPIHFEIDHFEPKGQLEFANKIHDWENLFYICEKCNGVRPKNINTKGKEVLNNCIDDVENLIYLQIIDNKVNIILNSNDLKSINTKKLLNRIFNGIESKSKSYIYLRQEIKKSIEKFEKSIKKYYLNKDVYESEIIELLSKKTMSELSSYISFKRQLVREKYVELVEHFD